MEWMTIANRYIVWWRLLKANQSTTKQQRSNCLMFHKSHTHPSQMAFMFNLFDVFRILLKKRKFIISPSIVETKFFHRIQQICTIFVYDAIIHHIKLEFSLGPALSMAIKCHCETTRHRSLSSTNRKKTTSLLEN